jgi:sialate O-acetylesterase
MKNAGLLKCAAVCCAVAAAGAAFAVVEPGAPFSDGAVLQRGMKVPVWGTVDPPVSKMLRKVNVEFAGQKKTAVVGRDGEWRVDLDPMDASCEGRTMTISQLSPGFFFDSVVDKVEVKDVLVGEVWIASGQSNMECPIRYSAPRYRDGNGAFMIQKTHKPLVRFVKNERNWSLKPAELKATWRKFEPESFKHGHRGLSAVAFYYALELHEALGIPIGIVDSSWGGSPIEAWLPRDEIAKHPELAKIAAYKVCEKADWSKDPEIPQCWSAEMQPGVLFDGMVAAFTPMAMRGMIWYQGCTNSKDGDLYAVKLHALCDGWSRKFENPNMKLYLCALAPFSTTWFGIVKAQTKFADDEPRAAVAYLSDAGNPNDVHPNDKRTPAMRLAIHALKRDYGFADVIDNSPSFESAKVEGDVVSVTFKDAKEIYIYNRDYTLDSGFELAGEDGKFVKAAIQNKRPYNTGDGHLGAIGGNVLMLKADGVAAPKKVRYLYSAPVKGAIYNEVNLPLGAFESDL